MLWLLDSIHEELLECTIGTRRCVSHILMHAMAIVASEQTCSSGRKFDCQWLCYKAQLDRGRCCR